MPAERKYTRAEMLAKPVSRIQTFANRSPYDYEDGSVQQANRKTARSIWDEYHAGKLVIENGYFKPKTNTTMPKKRTKPEKKGANKQKPKFNVGDRILFKRRAVWGGDDQKEAKIISVEYDDEFGYSYATDIMVNSQPTVVMEKRIIKKIKPKTNTTMKKRTKPAKAAAVTKKAVSIYDEQKATYQKLLKTKVRQGKKVTVAAKEASKIYKEMYGATPTARWKRAVREAKNS